MFRGLDHLLVTCILLTPYCVQCFIFTDLKLYKIVVYLLRNNFLNVFISIKYLL
jgi:hypothetical protein